MNPRQEYILKQLQHQHSVKVEIIAAAFHVSTQTIRRDMSALCDRGLAARIHGGVRRVMTTSTIDYEKRRQLDVKAKSRIAYQASKLIQDRSAVAINIGTTTEQVAQALIYHQDLTVITNNINVIHILRMARMKSLIIVGGEIRLSDGAIIGSDAIDAFRHFKVDMAVIGASSLDVDGSVLDFDKREVAVSRAILANARTRMLVCGHAKFGVSAPYRICHANDLDYIVTDLAPPRAFSTVVKQSKTKLVITEETDGTPE